MSIKALKHALELAEIAALDIEESLNEKPSTDPPSDDKDWIVYGKGTDVEIRLKASALPRFDEPAGSLEAASKKLAMAKAFMASGGPWDSAYELAHDTMRWRIRSALEEEIGYKIAMARGAEEDGPVKVGDAIMLKGSRHTYKITQLTNRLMRASMWCQRDGGHPRQFSPSNVAAEGRTP